MNSIGYISQNCKKVFLQALKIPMKLKSYWSILLQGTGTRDLIWLKVVSLDKSWLGGAYGQPLKVFKMLLYIFNKFFLKV